jgi:uncharacterized protein (DUF58 family)
VREAERDSALDVWLLLDCTASMGQGDAVAPERSRMRVAQTLAAALVELAWRQGDRLGLLRLGDGRLSMMPAGMGSSMRDRCGLALESTRAQGAWPAASALAPIYAAIQQQALVIVLSDCFEPALLSLVEKLSHGGREVRVLQMITAEERDFNYSGGRLFVDVESGIERLSDAPAARADYLRSFALAQAALQRQLTTVGVACRSLVLDQPLLPALSWLADPHSRRSGLSSS